VIDQILAYGDSASSEIILVGDGYGGMSDLLMDCPECWRLFDYKTTKKLPEKGPWTEHKLQLAGYAQAFQQKLVRAGSRLKPIIVANIYISTLTPGSFVVHEHEDWEGTYEKGFRPLVQHWQWMTGYVPTPPDFWKREPEPEPVAEEPEPAAAPPSRLPPPPKPASLPFDKPAAQPQAVPAHTPPGKKVVWTPGTVAPSNSQPAQQGKPLPFPPGRPRTPKA